MRVRSCSFLFTINNPAQPLNFIPLNLAFWRNIPRYAIYQLEVGENGTPHLQGYIVFNNTVRGSTVKNYFGCNPHLEARRGTHTQAKDYCSKEDTRVQGPWTFGDDEGIPEGQGQRSDLAAVKRKLDDGCKLSVIADEHFSDYIRYSKGFKEYKRLKSDKRDWVMEIITLIGDTGVGKTHWAYDNYGEDIYSVPSSKKSGCYWDDYDGQETVIVDEMYGNRFAWGFLLMLTDKYPFTVPTHGGSMNFNSKRIIFTSNAHPDSWYETMVEKTGMGFFDGPLYRRLVRGNSCIIRVDKDHSLNMLYFK